MIKHKQHKMTGDSKAIITNQTGIHEKLELIVEKHFSYPFQKPYQEHTQQAFEQIDVIVQAFLLENPNSEVILDSCCGVGQSTRLLAKRNPKALVIGVDKSEHRITRNVEDDEHNDNYHLVRADLNDFYRLVKMSNWPIKKHYILYPNPWPKAKHLQRRWHGSSVFPTLITIGEQIILRSNWRLYLEEFQLAADIAGLVGDITPVNDNEPITPFEAKYQASDQQCWQLIVKSAYYGS